MFTKSYGNVFDGNPQWNAIPVTGGELYQWNETSTYIQHPPFFERDDDRRAVDQAVEQPARAGDLRRFGHDRSYFSGGQHRGEQPGGASISISQGVKKTDFNQYGTRRGNDRVMTRGTFANIRIKNLMVPGVEGGVTIHQPDGEQMSIYDAAMKYKEAGIYSVVLAGKEYGTGSSRDYAAKGPYLQGVRAVIAESFERIHRSNLVGMGILPLQFKDGQNVESLGLTGKEVIEIVGLGDDLKPRQDVTVKATEGRWIDRGIQGHGAHRYAGGGGVLSERRYSCTRC